MTKSPADALSEAPAPKVHVQASPTIPAGEPWEIAGWISRQYREAVAQVDPGFLLPDAWAALPRQRSSAWQTYENWVALALARNLSVKDYFAWRLKPSTNMRTARRKKLVELLSAVDLDRWCGVFRRTHEKTHATTVEVTREMEEFHLRHREASCIAAKRPFLNKPLWYALKREAEGGHPLDHLQRKQG